MLMKNMNDVQAKPALETGYTRELVDPKLRDKYDDQQLNRLVLTASHCVQQSPILRPTMTQVSYMHIKHHSYNKENQTIQKPNSNGFDVFVLLN